MSKTEQNAPMAPAVGSLLDRRVRRRVAEVMQAMWALWHSGPKFYGRERDVEMAILKALEAAETDERERCATLCRDLMPAEGVIRRTLLDLEAYILAGQTDPRRNAPNV